MKKRKRRAQRVLSKQKRINSKGEQWVRELHTGSKLNPCQWTCPIIRVGTSDNMCPAGFQNFYGNSSLFTLQSSPFWMCLLQLSFLYLTIVSWMCQRQITCFLINSSLNQEQLSPKSYIRGTSSPSSSDAESEIIISGLCHNGMRLWGFLSHNERINLFCMWE